MFGSIRKFAKNRKGAFAMQFALMAVPLCICTGLAIDGGRAFLARFELASALDAAALAVGSTTTTGADLNAVAKKYVDINFKTEHDKPIDLKLVVTDDKALLTGSVEINTYFMPLIGQPTVKVSAESEVRVGGNNVEVALALDITASMNSTRMSGLKSAAKLLISEVVNTVQTPYFSKVAVAPWGTNLSIGTKHVPTGTLEALRGTARGTTNISGATWRAGSVGTQTITSAGWRTSAGGKTVTAVAWKNGGEVTISSIAKSGSTILVTTSANHNYANGDFVRITGAGNGFTTVNNGIYVVADKANKTFTLKNTSNAYITPPTGSPVASGTAIAQRCYDSACNVAITPNASLSLAVGDRVRITDVKGFTSVNNGADQSWAVAYLVPSTNAFTIAGLTGPSYATTFATSSSSVASKCYLTDCKFQVTTGTTSHGLSNGNYVYIWGASVTSSGTSMNSVANSSWAVTKLNDTQFTLPGSGYDYQDWSSAGSIARCLNSTCNVQITSTAHGLATGERVEIKSVGTLTGVNTGTDGTASNNWTTSNIVPWTATNLNANTFLLQNTTPALANMSGNYSSGGTAQCLSNGCAKIIYRSAISDNGKSGNGVERIRPISTCVTERVGSAAAKDTKPGAGVWLAADYPGSDTLVSCNTGNYVTPLTSNKDRLNTAIDDLVVTGSTAGEIGIAWGWYMISPNFKTLWTKEAENAPLDYGTKELAKVVILMTDGEFNTAHCNGVTSEYYAYSTVPYTDRIEASDCAVSTAPFAQAQAICTAMKKEKILIYTVGFQLDMTEGGDEFLAECASGEDYAFLATNNTELTTAFKKIATSISKLRISK